MKKTIFILTLLFAISCTNINKKDFTPVKNLYTNGFSFEEGDILILNKLANMYSVFGHSAIVLDKGKVGEYPMYGYGYIEVGLGEWIESSLDRSIIILRTDLDNEQKEKLKNLIIEYSTGVYGIFNKKISKEEFYCSSFVWKVYYELGIDLKENSNFFVFPYDFLKTDKLKKVSSP